MNNRNSKNHVANVAKYQKNKVHLYHICVDNTDTDIITWLAKQKNMSGAIRELIRKDIRQKAKQRVANQKLRNARREQKICIYCSTQDERTMSGKAVCYACYERMKSRR